MRRPACIRIWGLARLVLFLPALSMANSCVHAQTPSPALLILEKSDNTLAIVDPGSLKIVGRVPLQTPPTAHNQHYMNTKRSKLGHILDEVAAS